jgi:phytanoyl-CoA hydroxylase
MTAPPDLKTRYEADGFVFLPGLLGAELMDPVCAAVDSVLAEARPGDPRFDFEPGLVDGRPAVQRIKKPHDVVPACNALARAPAILDLVEVLIGSDIRLHHSKINVKPPQVGSPLEWHQDWAFVPHTNQSLVFVSVFIDDVPAQKGPLQLIPGSHRQGLRDHHDAGVFYGAIDPGSLPLDRAAALTGPRGSVSLHHPLAVHGSGHNVSNRLRRMLFFEYAATDAWPLTYGVDWPEFESRIVRGRSCIHPRLENVPVTMPFPAPSGGAAKIYAQQSLYPNRYFKAPA